MIGPILIIGFDRLTNRQRNYWISLASRMQGRIDIIDPFRHRLTTLRSVYGRCSNLTVYRAATPGRYGQSAEIKTL